MPTSHAQLLGSPLGDVASISAVLADKVEALRRLGEHLKFLSAHDALVLLRNCFAIPKLLYVLRTSPCFRSTTLQTYDDCLRGILGSVTNVHLGRSSSAWSQATLPVKLGGLGVRSAVAFLASAISSSELVNAILPPSLKSFSSPLVIEAQSYWSAGHDHQVPEVAVACKQKAWDGLRAASTAERLLEGAENDEERARLLSVSTNELGAWLRALPMTALGLRMDDNTVRVAVGLRLGTAVCGPHSC